MKQSILKFCKNHPTFIGLLGFCLLILPFNFIDYEGSDVTLTEIMYIGSYTYFVTLTIFLAHIRKQSKYWAILGFLGWIIISSIPLKDSNTVTKNSEINKPVSSSIQFLGMIGIIGSALYGANGNIVGWIISGVILVFLIWYTRKHK